MLLKTIALSYLLAYYGARKILAISQSRFPYVANRLVIPAKAGIQKHRNYTFWMPDRVRHDVNADFNQLP
jgi:hypothetical protein